MMAKAKPKAPDPRLNAYRGDLAAASLKGKVEAPCYEEGVTRQVIAPCLALRREPRPDAPLDTEALMGEEVVLYDEDEGWAWVQLERDGYVGYLAYEGLGITVRAPSHRVSGLRTFIFPGPDIKLPPLAALSLNAAVTAVGESGDFVELATGGFVHARHLVAANAFADDFVEVATRFLGTPYLWGGRTGFGVDCSGLVQIAIEAAGGEAPRDSDMQAASLGRALKGKFDPAKLQRGDLVFWEGHVGIMADTTNLLHASALFMETVIEPLDEALATITEFGLEVTVVRRL